MITRFMDGKLDVCAAAQPLEGQCAPVLPYRCQVPGGSRQCRAWQHRLASCQPHLRRGQERLRALAGEGGTYHDFNTSHIHEVKKKKNTSRKALISDAPLSTASSRRWGYARSSARCEAQSKPIRRRERRSAEGMMLPERCQPPRSASRGAAQDDLGGRR